MIEGPELRNFYAEQIEAVRAKGRIASKRSYERNKEKHKARAKAWQQAHPEQARELNRNWRQKNLQKMLLINAKRNAKNNNREFDLTLEDIVIPTHCPILGIELTFGGKRNNSSYSVDRIDNSKGYIKGNIQIISWLANRMKSDATQEQLIKFATFILNTSVY